MPSLNRALSQRLASLSAALDRLEVGDTDPPDPVEWAEGRLGFGLDDWQREVMCSDDPRLLLLCPRQSGKSTVVAARTAYRLTHRPGHRIIVLAPTIRQSSLLSSRVADILAGDGVRSESATRITMHHGAELLALPGDQPKGVRGATADEVVLDEASRVRDELVVACFPMVSATDGSIAMLSTPAGAVGAFHAAWKAADAEGWVRRSVTVDDVSHYSDRAIATMRRRLGDRQFAQEFENAFLDAPGALFDAATIDDLFANRVVEHVPLAATGTNDYRPLF